jgi:hypothetical protein
MESQRPHREESPTRSILAKGDKISAASNSHSINTVDQRRARSGKHDFTKGPRRAEEHDSQRVQDLDDDQP